MTLQPPFADLYTPLSRNSALRHAVTAAYRRPERECLAPLIEAARFPAPLRDDIRATALRLVRHIRANPRASGLEALVQEYSLSSQEGVALMCLAEALLRIPDNDTRDALIADKIAHGNWASHLARGKSMFVNAATWGLVVTGRLVATVNETGLAAALERLVARAGEPVIRRGVDLAMRMMGEHFVTGETIGEALAKAARAEAKGYRYSYDMLGEAAMTADDAARYRAAYTEAIEAIGAASAARGVLDGPGISVKLSALHPRYQRAQLDRLKRELLPDLRDLALRSRRRDIGFNIDAEEADRLELSLDMFEALARDPALDGWDGLGFVVQGYGKRCPQVIDWLIDLARSTGRRFMVRLVKGAYWDAEIKRAQVDGLADFPVYTRKSHTDVAYIACARKLLDARDAVFPQFATHNAQTVATIHHLAGGVGGNRDYEFQCLHGMGEQLYEQVIARDGLDTPCRIYAPVGSHDTLLAYLVRRLLENGANSSFVHRIGDPQVPIVELVGDPVDPTLAEPEPGAPHPRIALPAELYPDRRNSSGLDLTDEERLAELSTELGKASLINWRAGNAAHSPSRQVLNPADHRDRVGTVAECPVAQVPELAARAAHSDWGNVSVEQRAQCLESAADTFQARMAILAGLIVREAGRTLPNALSEVREAVDFLRYYAAQSRLVLGRDSRPIGPTACISPWNFPLAIFTGQVAAALAAGNPVLAKPAEETPLIAAEAVRLLHEAGVPADALQLVPGDGTIGAALVEQSEIAGVVFTGSTAVARNIQQAVADRVTAAGAPVVLIAETGGQNAMIVDSSALPEQVVADVIASAFDSAGQRCSALRVLCLQEDIAERTLAMLKGAMRELRIGRPDALAVDVGPVISAEARDGIEAHVAAMQAAGKRITRLPMGEDSAHGTFVAPTLIEIDAVSELEREVFGPVLHVLRFQRDEIGELIDAVNATGYGLTFGIHSRLDGAIADLAARADAGNVYVNRNMVGAVVGVQPFGGRGLSGTGPKAGGPLYLPRLARPSPLPGLPVGTPDPRLLELAEWLDGRGESKLAGTARAYGGAAPLGCQVDLPGPVGETNRYRLEPRGTILLLPQSREGLIEQMAAVLASGNQGAVVGMALPEDLPGTIAAAFGKSGPVAGGLVEGGKEQVIAAARMLVERSGPIVPLHAADPDARLVYPAHFLLEEKTVCINTTAAGGNASLMAMD